MSCSITQVFFFLRPDLESDLCRCIPDQARAKPHRQPTPRDLKKYYINAHGDREGLPKFGAGMVKMRAEV